MATSHNVLGFFSAHSRECCVTSISRVVNEVEYKEDLELAEIGRRIGCSKKTVENAKYKKTLLEFDCIARLLALWPQHCDDIRNLWELQPRDPETPTEKRKRLIRELAALEDV